VSGIIEDLKNSMVYDAPVNNPYARDFNWDKRLEDQPPTTPAPTPAPAPAPTPAPAAKPTGSALPLLLGAAYLLLS
jgi:hypothetical protein